MKKLLLILILITGIVRVNAQTATDFTAIDCEGASYNLFNELNSGKAVVLCWVMPCSICIGGTLTCNNVCESYPANVEMFLCDDYANTNCIPLNSWAMANNITFPNQFSDASINMLDYGSTGMPKIVVVGGSNHTVFYNVNGAPNPSDLQDAIDHALSANGIDEQTSIISALTIFPSPANNVSSLKYTSTKSGETTLDLFDLQGKLVKNVYSGKSIIGENVYNINVETYPEGTYLVKLKQGDKSRYANIIVAH